MAGSASSSSARETAIAPASLATTRRLGTAVLVAVTLFVVTCTTMQVLREDLDWMRAPLSLYLIGAHGAWVQAAYGGLAVGLVLLGAGCRAALSPPRSSAPLLLFALAAVALCVTAFASTDRDRSVPTLEGLVHVLAAQSTFLSVTTAMLMQAWRFRADAQWRHRFGTAFALALLAFVALWVHAFWREAPRGMMQKSVIALILTWLGLVGYWLRKGDSGRRADGATAAD